MHGFGAIFETSPCQRSYPIIFFMSFFDHIEKRPKMYLGTSRAPFSSLLAFMRGYGFGLEHAAKSDFHEEPDQLALPDGFREFVAARLGIDPKMNVGSWEDWILKNSSSEDEALQRFFTLRKQMNEKL